MMNGASGMVLIMNIYKYQNFYDISLPLGAGSGLYFYSIRESGKGILTSGKIVVE